MSQFTSWVAESWHLFKGAAVVTRSETYLLWFVLLSAEENKDEFYQKLLPILEEDVISQMAELASTTWSILYLQGLQLSLFAKLAPAFYWKNL